MSIKKLDFRNSHAELIVGFRLSGNLFFFFYKKKTQHKCHEIRVALQQRGHKLR